MNRIEIGTGRLRAAFEARGAQLRSLRLDGTELLWQAGDPWHYTAPVLFPLISKLPGNVLHHAGRDHDIPSHGVARTADWQHVASDADSVSYLLRSSVETLDAFPFPFELLLDARAGGSALELAYTVTNTGDEPLPFLLGGHPAFLWPLPGAVADAPHTVTWESGGATMRQAVDGLRPGRLDSPVIDGRLHLQREFFAEDALLFDDIEPRVATYTAEGAASITLRYDDYPVLGVWSKPGDDAAFVCLEPWSGYPATADFAADIVELPGAELLAPGASRTFRHTIEIGNPA